MNENEFQAAPVAPHIRWMIRRDMPETLCIEQGSNSSPWSMEDFLVCLRHRNVIGMVAEDIRTEKVVGFMVYELHKRKLHVINFAVSPERRRDGVGKAMMAKLVSKLSSHRRKRITLEVRETNLDAQLFYRAQGMKAKKVVREYYHDTGEDAYLMEYALPDEPDNDDFDDFVVTGGEEEAPF